MRLVHAVPEGQAVQQGAHARGRLLAAAAAPVHQLVRQLVARPLPVEQPQANETADARDALVLRKDLPTLHRLERQRPRSVLDMVAGVGGDGDAGAVHVHAQRRGIRRRERVRETRSAVG